VQPDRGPVGIFVLRVWNEGPEPGRLRIRIVSTRDAAGRQRRTHVTDSADAACDALRAWLEEFELAATSPQRVTER
jgi:hypothetical protein